MKAAFPILLLAACLLVGCETTRATNPAGTPRVRLTDLAKGLTPDEVRAMWGQPTEVRDQRADADNVVVWIYHRLIKASDFPVATTIDEVPYFDPLTGVYTPIKDPHYTLATTELTQTIELVFVDGRLSAWKRSLSEEKNFR